MRSSEFRQGAEQRLEVVGSNLLCKCEKFVHERPCYQNSIHRGSNPVLRSLQKAHTPAACFAMVPS